MKSPRPARGRNGSHLAGVARTAAVVALALHLHGETAAAQSSDAEALITEGLRMRRARQFEAALARFREAYERAHGARARAQMGITEQGMGRWSDAHADLRAALAERADPWIARNRAALEAALAVVEGHVGRLTVVGGPAGAEVLFNGRPIGTLPMREATVVDAGTGALVARRQGWLEVRRSVHIEPRGEARESVELVEALAPLPPAPRPVVVPPPAPLVVARRAPVEPLVAPPGTPATRVWAAVAGGAALAFAGIGIVGLVQRADAVDGFNAIARCQGVLDATTYAQCDEMRRDAETDQSRGDALMAVGFGVAGALAATAVVLLAWPQGSRPAPRASQLTCTWGPGAVGLACGARF